MMFKLKLPLYVLIFLLINLFFFYTLKVRFIHDTLEFYTFFKYFYDFHSIFNYWPLWINEIDYGNNAFLYFSFLGALNSILIPIFSFFKLNSFLVYQIYIILLFFLLVYGFYLNIKDHDNKFYKTIIFLSLYFSSSVFFSSLNNDLILTIPILYIIYYAKKFNISSNINYLTKTIWILIFYFVLTFEYRVVFLFYFTLLTFLISLFFYNFNIVQTFNKIKIINIFCLLLSIIIFITIIFVFKNNFNAQFESMRSERGDVDFDHWRNFSSLPIKEFFARIFSGFFIRLGSGFNDVFFHISLFPLALSIIYLIRENNFKHFLVLKSNKFLDFRFNLFISLVFFLIFISNITIIDKFFYSLPFMDITRHKNYMIIILKPIVFLFISIFFVNQIFKKKEESNVLSVIVILLILLCLFLSNIFIERMHSGNKINTYYKSFHYIQMCIYVFLSLIFLLKNKVSKKIIFYSTVITSIFLNFWQYNSLLKFSEDQERKLYYQTFIKTKIKGNFQFPKEKCLNDTDFIKKYEKLIYPNDKKFAVYSSLLMITDNNLCNPSKILRNSQRNSNLKFINDNFKIQPYKTSLSRRYNKNETNLCKFCNKNYYIFNNTQNYEIINISKHNRNFIKFDLYYFSQNKTHIKYEIYQNGKLLVNEKKPIDRGFGQLSSKKFKVENGKFSLKITNISANDIYLRNPTFNLSFEKPIINYKLLPKNILRFKIDQSEKSKFILLPLLYDEKFKAKYSNKIYKSESNLLELEIKNNKNYIDLEYVDNFMKIYILFLQLFGLFFLFIILFIIRRLNKSIT